MKKTYKYLWIMLFLIFSMSTVSADEITADSLTYNGKSQIVTATGNVIIQNNEGAIITGNEGEYNFITHTAYITNFFLLLYMLLYNLLLIDSFCNSITFSFVFFSVSIV